MLGWQLTVSAQYVAIHMDMWPLSLYSPAFLLSNHVDLFLYLRSTFELCVCERSGRESYMSTASAVYSRKKVWLRRDMIGLWIFLHQCVALMILITDLMRASVVFFSLMSYVRPSWTNPMYTWLYVSFFTCVHMCCVLIFSPSYHMTIFNYAFMCVAWYPVHMFGHMSLICFHFLPVPLSAVLRRLWAQA